jgi:hypothetical protein
MTIPQHTNRQRFFLIKLESIYGFGFLANDGPPLERLCPVMISICIPWIKDTMKKEA